MIWIIVTSVVGFILYKFFSDLGKDKQVLREGLDKKFEIIVNNINDIAFQGLGTVKYTDQRSFNLYKSPSNQIIFFHFGTGILTITWRYKYFQKEVVYERSFKNTRNLSVFEQQKIAEMIAMEILQVIENHQINVLGALDDEDELIDRLRKYIKNN